MAVEVALVLPAFAMRIVARYQPVFWSSPTRVFRELWSSASVSSEQPRDWQFYIRGINPGL
jgi:hypothetical protein